MPESAAALSKDQPGARLPGEEGVWMLVFGDLITFALLFATYLVYRADAPELYNESQQQLNLVFGTANTIVLLTSSWLIAISVGALRGGSKNASQKLLLSAIACGLIFALVKIAEYTEKFGAGYGVGTNDFYMFYFMYTGIHFLHVIVGMVVLSVLYFQIRKSAAAAAPVAALESGATFWHLVDLLWIILFALFYLVR